MREDLYKQVTRYLKSLSAVGYTEKEIAEVLKVIVDMRSDRPEFNE